MANYDDSTLVWTAAMPMLTGTNMRRQPNTRRFYAMFGISAELCYAIWQALEDKRPPNSDVKHLLWRLMFLKVYGSESVHATIAGTDEKTFRKWCWLYVALISELDIIRWENRFIGAAEDARMFVSLDGTDMRIQEPRPFDRKWFSHKFHGPGLRYELGICIRTGHIVWSNGGVPCGQYPDLLLAREAYVHAVAPGEMTLADRGYRDPEFFVTPDTHNLSAGLQKRIMARHETANARLKKFGALRLAFRHSLHLHHSCFQAIVNIVQLEIENESPLFSIEEYLDN
ncbi:hypothetical protein AC1031_002342 [Aphanomyces cochlioides]|nr:hypothetical protein AC1031_002342 [Aphanomyces cochlioides]